MTDTTDQQAADARQATRKSWLIRLGLTVVVLGALWGLWYVLVGRNSTSTDDAYVDAEMAQVTPLTSASVVAVHVSDTQFVKAGTVLVELDPTDARISVAQAQADLAEARRKFRQNLATGHALAAQVQARGADIAAAGAQVKSARAAADEARLELNRREALAASGGVSGEEVTVARKNFATASAALASAEAAQAQSQSSRTSASGQYDATAALTQGLS